MSQFSTQWLDLREPLDAASRATPLCTAVAEDLALRRKHPARLAVIDLGAGTGANLRYAAPRLGGAQDWLLVERDPLLRAAIEDRMRSWAPITAAGPPLVLRDAHFECGVRTVQLDLATQLHELPLPHEALLTASALLDLVSAPWLASLARRAADAAAIVWFALTYDGAIECQPAEPEDAEVRELFNRHQLNDKGFGPALGPAAARRAGEIFTAHGYQVRWAPSPWCLGPDQPALQYALIEGWFAAACEIAPQRLAVLRGWLARRRAHIDGGRSELQVGHLDMIGRPASG